MTFPQVRIDGEWFNVDPNTDPGRDGRKGDLIPEIRLQADDGKVVARLYLCDDEDCNNFTELFSDDTTFGPVKLDTMYRLSITFVDRITFSFGFNGETIRVPLDKMPTIIGPAHSPFRSLFTGVFGLAPGEDGLVVARFDNVFVDRIPYDDFSPITKPVGSVSPPETRFPSGPNPDEM
jgi:hypothetical protein